MGGSPEGPWEKEEHEATPRPSPRSRAPRTEPGGEREGEREGGAGDGKVRRGHRERPEQDRELRLLSGGQSGHHGEVWDGRDLQTLSSRSPKIPTTLHHPGVLRALSSLAWTLPWALPALLQADHSPCPGASSGLTPTVPGPSCGGDTSPGWDLTIPGGISQFQVDSQPFQVDSHHSSWDPTRPEMRILPHSFGCSPGQGPGPLWIPPFPPVTSCHQFEEEGAVFHHFRNFPFPK